MNHVFKFCISDVTLETLLRYLLWYEPSLIVERQWEIGAAWEGFFPGADELPNDAILPGHELLMWATRCSAYEESLFETVPHSEHVISMKISMDPGHFPLIECNDAGLYHSLVATFGLRNHNSKGQRELESSSHSATEVVRFVAWFCLYTPEAARYWDVQELEGVRLAPEVPLEVRGILNSDKLLAALGAAREVTAFDATLMPDGLRVRLTREGHVCLTSTPRCDLFSKVYQKMAPPNVGPSGWRRVDAAETGG